MHVAKCLQNNVCAKCGAPKLVRPDGCPFCSKCEQEALEQFARMRPDLAAKGKLQLRWLHQTEREPEQPDDGLLEYEDL